MLCFRDGNYEASVGWFRDGERRFWLSGKEGGEGFVDGEKIEAMKGEVGERGREGGDRRRMVEMEVKGCE